MDNATIKAAWIGGACAIVAALIGAAVTVKTGQNSSPTPVPTRQSGREPIIEPISKAEDSAKHTPPLQLPEPARANHSLENTLRDIQLAAQRGDLARLNEFSESPASAESIGATMKLYDDLVRSGRQAPRLLVRDWTIESSDGERAKVRVVLEERQFSPTGTTITETTGYWLFSKRAEGWRFRDGETLSERQRFEAR
jgi:hypothetical protein